MRILLTILVLAFLANVGAIIWLSLLPQVDDISADVLHQDAGGDKGKLEMQVSVAREQLTAIQSQKLATKWITSILCVNVYLILLLAVFFEATKNRRKASVTGISDAPSPRPSP